MMYNKNGKFSSHRQNRWNQETEATTLLCWIKVPVKLLIFEILPTVSALFKSVLLLLLRFFPIESFNFLVKYQYYYYYLFSEFFPPVWPYYNQYYYWFLDIFPSGLSFHHQYYYSAQESTSLKWYNGSSAMVRKFTVQTLDKCCLLFITKKTGTE